MSRRPISLVLLAILALGACGDDDGDDQASGNVERYCELTKELDAAGSEAFDALEDDETATEEDFERAMEEFNAAHADDFQELRRVAPAEIRDDVDRFLDAMEAGAHGEEEAEPDLAEVEERIQAFEEENCL